MTRKIILITFACSVLIAYGVWQQRLAAHSDLVPQSFKPANVEVGIAPPAGSKFVRSYESSVNGQKARFAHYVSHLPAEGLVDRFIEGQGEAPGRGQAPNVIRGAGCVAAGCARGSDVVSVVAFDSPSGCNFFITRSPMVVQREGSRRSTDAPGVDAPRVPRPLDSVRLLSVENLGGVPSVLAFYEGWGTMAANADYLRKEMGRLGWQEQRLAGKLMAQELEGSVLSFAKGTKRCLIYLEKDPRSGKLTTAVLYRVKDWLPPGPVY
jgi:hypothetical protein